jgi:hypothetical protein
MTIIVIMLKRLLFVVATIIATTAAAPSSSKCEEQTKCGKCFNTNPEMNCTWIMIVSDETSGNSGGGKCVDSDDNNQCNIDIETSTSLSSCATGVNIETRKKLKKKKWKQKNNEICKKLKKSMIPAPPKLCSDYSGNCKSCLSNKNNGCSWVPVTNDCVSSCTSDEAPQDVGCFPGLLSRKKSKSTCKSFKVEEQNSQLCQTKSQTNCNECTQTELKLPNGQTKPVQPVCKWFPADKDAITIGGSGGSCDSRCTFEGDCGVTTCDAVDIDDPADLLLDEQNSQLCQTKSQLNCNECTQTELKLPDGQTILIQPVCKWFPADKDAITIGGSGGSCDSRCTFEGDCGVTTCDAVGVEDTYFLTRTPTSPPRVVVVDTENTDFVTREPTSAPRDVVVGVEDTYFLTRESTSPPRDVVVGIDESDFLTMKPTLPLPGPRTKFPQYGPKNGLTGNYVKEQLLDLYPIGLNIVIIEHGSPITKDIRPDRVRIYVESNDSDVDDDDDDNLGDRLVMDIPQIG